MNHSCAPVSPRYALRGVQSAACMCHLEPSAVHHAAAEPDVLRQCVTATYVLPQVWQDYEVRRHLALQRHGVTLESASPASTEALRQVIVCVNGVTASVRGIWNAFLMGVVPFVAAPQRRQHQP